MIRIDSWFRRFSGHQLELLASNGEYMKPQDETKPGSAGEGFPRWDFEAEVVIVGYGGAGAAAAIEAHDAGADVLILEKQKADTPTYVHHTPSSRMCAGALLVP